MKLLLDENLPRQLKKVLAGHHVFSVRDMKWNGIENGELLALMLKNGFEAFLTMDANLQHQQNFRRYSIPVLVIRVWRNTYPFIEPLLPEILELLNSNLPSGPTEINGKR